MSVGQARPSRGPLRSVGRIALTAADIALPIGLYYVLRGVGVSNLVALTAGSAVSACSALAQLIRTRHVDAVAMLVLASLLVTMVVSLISDNPRFILAKEGALTGLWGLWFLLSVRARRPAAFVFARPLMEGRRVFGSANWEQLWDREPGFRRIWRVASVIWATALLIDAGIRVAIAWVLPVHEVPALSGALWPVTFVVIQVVTNTYYRRAGLYRILGVRWAGAPASA